MVPCICLGTTALACHVVPCPMAAASACLQEPALVHGALHSSQEHALSECWKHGTFNAAVNVCFVEAA